jgi:hypothetical protein
MCVHMCLSVIHSCAHIHIYASVGMCVDTCMCAYACTCTHGHILNTKTAEKSEHQILSSVGTSLKNGSWRHYANGDENSGFTPKCPGRA